VTSFQVPVSSYQSERRRRHGPAARCQGIRESRIRGVERGRPTAYSSQLTAPRAARLVSSTGKRGLAQGWIPLQKQERRLLRVRERGPERTLFRGLELALLWTQARKPLRHQGR
jgi:hypothetical protein